MSPLRLLNMFAVQIPVDTGKPSRVALIPAPGRVSRVDLGATIQGIYCEPGVRSGALFAVAGGHLYSISSSWVATDLGAVSGSGNAVFAGLRDALYVARAAKPYKYDGATLTQVSDVDAPDASSLLVLSQRLVASEASADTYYWSDTLDGTAWEALGFATAEQRPDAILRMVRLAGQIVAMGASSLEIIRATGDVDLPFANITGQSIDETEGIIGPDAYAIRGDKLFLIGGNLSPYVMTGFNIQALPPNGEMEDDLIELSAANRLLITCMAYQFGSNEFFKVRIPGKAAYVLNTSTGFWHREQSWEQDTYLPRWHAVAYGYDVLADDGGTEIYTLSNTTYDDDGATIERMVTLRPMFQNYTTIGSLCLDLQAYGRPLTGQGSDATLMVTVSTDGRNTEDTNRNEVTLQTGIEGTYLKPVLWGLGMIPPGEGATITIRMTDPVGLTLYGAWLNEGQKS